MDCWETFCIKPFQQKGLLTQEQYIRDLKLQYMLVQHTDRNKTEDVYKTSSQTQRNQYCTFCDTGNYTKKDNDSIPHIHKFVM